MPGLTRRAVLASLSIASLPVQAQAAGDQRLSPLARPERLEDAPFQTADGQEVRPSRWLGQGLVINLWATWCAPCVREMPALDQMARLLAADRIAVLALSSDRGGAAVVRPFYERTRLRTLDIWLDPRGAAGRTWGVRGLPTTLIVDPAGFLRARVEGEVDWAGAPAVAFVRTLAGATPG